jgi:catalase
MDDFERDDLVLNLTTLLGQCDVDIQQQMVGHFLRCDEEYGSRVAQGLGVDLDDARKAVEEVDRFIAEREQRHTGRS